MQRSTHLSRGLKMHLKNRSLLHRAHSRFRPLFKPLAIVMTCLIMSSCAMLDATGMRGASSMTIDVEVYKGPLSKSIETQNAELYGIVRDAGNVFYLLNQEAYAISDSEPCSTTETNDKPNETTIINKTKETKETILVENIKSENNKNNPPIKSGDCIILENLIYDSNLFINEDNSTDVLNFNNLGIYIKIKDSEFSDGLSDTNIIGLARIGAAFRTRADYWASLLSTRKINKQKNTSCSCRLCSLRLRNGKPDCIARRLFIDAERMH